MASALASYLRKNKISHAEFARRIGVTDSAVWRWAHGLRRPGLAAAFAIEKATKKQVKAADLLGRPSSS